MKKFGELVLKLFGWKVVGALPAEKKYIVIVAPHTSNWDFMVGLFARFAVGVKIHFIAKKQLFFFPLGTVLRMLGGSPIDRSKKENNVKKVAELFNSKEEFRLAITPEGTRSPVTRWKEGFYHIAVEAKIPLVFIALDFAKKEVNIGQVFWPTGNINQDFPMILDYFRAFKGRYPKVIPQYVAKDKG